MRSFIGILLVAIMLVTPARAEEGERFREVSGRAPALVMQLAPGLRVVTEKGDTLHRLDDMTFKLKNVRKHRWIAVRAAEGKVDVLADEAPEGLFVSDKYGRGYALVIAGDVGLVSTRKSLRVVNRAGEVLVTRDGRWRNLAAGQIFVTTGAADYEESVLPSPTTIDQGMGFVAVDSGGVEKSRACWAPVWGAVGYQVTVSDERGGPVTREQLPSEAVCSELPAARPGTYHLAVAAVDSAGVAGPATRTRVRRVGISVPPGSFVDDHGHVHLVPGHEATLHESIGLEVSATGNVWVPMRGTVSARPSRPLHYRLRWPGSAQYADLRVSARRDQMIVSVSPEHAVWPRDEVTVTIAPRSDANASPPWVEPTATVTVDVDVVRVHWERHRGRLRAKVPVPKGPGPWMVIADVRDQYGFPLGYGFAEVLNALGGASSTQRR